jgi:acyl-CoA synthetase (AMP-forming)/AMP-acid ligase II
VDLVRVVLWILTPTPTSVQVKRALGGRIRIMCSGSAPLAADIQEFMKVCFDVPMVEGYGLTETHAGLSSSSRLRLLPPHAPPPHRLPSLPVSAFSPPPPPSFSPLFSSPPLFPSSQPFLPLSSPHRAVTHAMVSPDSTLGHVGPPLASAEMKLETAQELEYTTEDR